MAEEKNDGAGGGRLRKVAMVWCALLTVFFAVWIGGLEHSLRIGTPVLVRPVPVDPRDLLRGQYMTLTYDFSRQAEELKDRQAGEECWVVLSPDEKAPEYHLFRRYEKKRPEELEKGEVAILGTVANNGWRNYVSFGIEKYFVPEGTATPGVQDLAVRLRIKQDGRPQIEQVFCKGKPWP